MRENLKKISENIYFTDCIEQETFVDLFTPVGQYTSLMGSLETRMRNL